MLLQGLRLPSIGFEFGRTRFFRSQLRVHGKGTNFVPAAGARNRATARTLLRRNDRIPVPPRCLSHSKDACAELA